MKQSPSSDFASACIFTYPPHYGIATMATRLLARYAIPVTWVVDKAHAGSVPHGRVVVSSANRNGNLNGRYWTMEQLDIMAEVGKDSEWILKVDSDTMVLGIDWLLRGKPDNGAIGLVSDPKDKARTLFGMCYALRPAIALAIRNSISSAPLNSIPLQEDLMVGHYARNHGLLQLPGGAPGRHEDGQWEVWDGEEDAEVVAGRSQVVLAIQGKTGTLSVQDIVKKMDEHLFGIDLERA